MHADSKRPSNEFLVWIAGKRQRLPEVLAPAQKQHVSDTKLTLEALSKHQPLTPIYDTINSFQVCLYHRYQDLAIIAFHTTTPHPKVFINMVVKLLFSHIICCYLLVRSKVDVASVQLKSLNKNTLVVQHIILNFQNTSVPRDSAYRANTTSNSFKLRPYAFEII